MFRLLRTKMNDEGEVPHWLVIGVASLIFSLIMSLVVWSVSSHNCARAKDTVTHYMSAQEPPVTSYKDVPADLLMRVYETCNETMSDK